MKQYQSALFSTHKNISNMCSWYLGKYKFPMDVSSFKRSLSNDMKAKQALLEVVFFYWLCSCSFFVWL